MSDREEEEVAEAEAEVLKAEEKTTVMGCIKKFKGETLIIAVY